MSRIAKQPVTLPDGVTVRQEGSAVVVKGPQAELRANIPSRRVKLAIDSGSVQVTPVGDESPDLAAAGLTRTLLANLVLGVTTDFTKELEFSGVGYRAEVAGATLKLVMGYSHPVELAIGPGLAVNVKKNVITVSGADKQAVGQLAANIRDVRPPEPYKGKGIHYVGEHIRRKAGKAGKATE